jgi:ubiquinone/menaquinone biosynthesis C-methylase UbiE
MNIPVLGPARARLAQRLEPQLRNLPPGAKSIAAKIIGRPIGGAEPPAKQELDVYWDPKMAEILETWGQGNAWNEIQLLLLNVRGTVVDIACGTGTVIEILAPYRNLEVHGFDISDFLISKAIERGIAKDRLRVTDATKTTYADNQFDYGYSIGSLEHFTEDGIRAFVIESHRIVKRGAFHMMPTSRSGDNEGWMTTLQSFHNNSVDWWVSHFERAYKTVHVLDSAWDDRISVGKWFLCMKDA